MSTPTKRFSVLALGLLLIVIFGACATGTLEIGPAAPQEDPGQVSMQETEILASFEPGEVVQNFYNDWLDYGRYTGNPLFDEHYKTSSYLSESGIARLEAEKGPQGWLADPVLCAQDLPESVTVESSTVEGDKASVLAVTSWDTRLGVDLVKVDQIWQIDSITCLGR